MKEFDFVKIRQLDPTALLVFQEAVRTGKLSHVAHSLGLTPSAVSHALARLRIVFGDPLFGRRSHGVNPTPRALELTEPIRAALSNLQDALEIGRVFSPAKLERTLRISTLDYAVATLMPQVIARFSKAAPNAALAVVDPPRPEAIQRIRSGLDDLAIGLFDAAPSDMIRSVIVRETFVTVARCDHPNLPRRLSLDDYCRLEHVMVSQKGETTSDLDVTLRGLGRRRRVVATMPSFLSILSTVGTSDCIASVPSRLARKYAKPFGLRIVQTPIPTGPYEVAALRWKSATPDPAADWLLDLFRKAHGRKLDEG